MSNISNAKNLVERLVAEEIDRYDSVVPGGYDAHKLESRRTFTDKASISKELERIERRNSSKENFLECTETGTWMTLEAIEDCAYFTEMPLAERIRKEFKMVEKIFFGMSVRKFMDSLEYYSSLIDVSHHIKVVDMDHIGDLYSINAEMIHMNFTFEERKVLMTLEYLNQVHSTVANK